eukprot:57280-Prorocentrum_minimum.AAC.2
MEKAHGFVAGAMDLGEMRPPPLHDRPPKPPHSETVSWTGANKLLERLYITPRVTDHGCAKQLVRSGEGQEVSEEDLRAYASLPLAPLNVSRWVEGRLRGQAGMAELGDASLLGRHVGKHPAAQTRLAQRSLKRVLDDVARCAATENAKQVITLRRVADAAREAGEGGGGDGGAAAAEEVDALVAALEAMLARDQAFLTAAANRWMLTALEWMLTALEWMLIALGWMLIALEGILTTLRWMRVSCAARWTRRARCSGTAPPPQGRWHSTCCSTRGRRCGITILLPRYCSPLLLPM